MDHRITASLHELVYAMDGYADRVLLRRFGIDRNLFAFLAPLARGPMDVTRLAESLNLTKAAVSKRVRPLEEEGWLVTSADPSNRRRVVLSLAPHAQALVAEAGHLLESRFADLLAGALIDPETFKRHLRGLIDAVRALDPDKDPS